MFFPKGELPTGYYVALHSKDIQRFPLIVTNNTSDTINGGLWYTLEGTLGQATVVSSSMTNIHILNEVQLYLTQIIHFQLPTKPPLHPRTLYTKPGFGPGLCVRPTNTSDQS